MRAIHLEQLSKKYNSTSFAKILPNIKNPTHNQHPLELLSSVGTGHEIQDSIRNLRY
jgi:hypothetical protein